VLGALDETQRTQLIVALEESMTVLVSYHANDPNVGMHFYRDTNRFKLFMMDTGLFVTLAFWDKDYTENIIYQKLILDKLQANMGYVYENLVAQMLTASGNKLYYYTFPKDEKHNYEIDFILSKGFKVCPIEVKSSGYKTHASLDAFCRKYSSRISQRYLICPNEFGHDQEIIYLPFNMVPLI
jgi:predicted AAA+ superfamily ATPase